VSAEKESLTLPLVILLTILVFLDLVIIAGILIHGKANFSALIHNLKT